MLSSRVSPQATSSNSATWKRESSRRQKSEFLNLDCRRKLNENRETYLHKRLVCPIRTLFAIKGSHHRQFSASRSRICNPRRFVTRQVTAVHDRQKCEGQSR